MKPQHGIDITRRPGHRNKIAWVCICGVTGSFKTIQKAYDEAAAHMQSNNKKTWGKVYGPTELYIGRNEDA